MRTKRIASAGLFALVASLLTITLASDPEEPVGEDRGHTSTSPTTFSHGDRAFDRVGAIAPSAVRVAPDAIEFASRAARSGNYRPGERMVRLADPLELPDLAARHGLEVARPVGRSGYAVLRGDPQSLEQLAFDPSIEAIARHGITYGASEIVGDDMVLNEDLALELEGAHRRSNSFGDATSGHTYGYLQWHIDKVDPPMAYSPPIEVVVAVIDTGVAYETATHDGVSYVAAPSLALSPIVAPYDFVNDDPHANDDHQHGTHIATLIAAHGEVMGTAPGVGLMPVKVLDETNRGTEYSLVEGIWWAVDHEADIINLSLSFGSGYQPSLALLEAIDAASDADILMVAAAGNDGLDRISWPAASPAVLAVGASELTSGRGDFNHQVVAPYSNASAGIDLIAPGGNLETDYDYDGLPDGILSETINPADPTDIGYWLMCGTSQAAAQVSGLAVELRRAGLSALHAESVMKYKAERAKPEQGRGSGYADMDWQVPWQKPAHEQFLVALLPYLASEGDQVRPRARVTVFEDDGTPAAYALVAGNIWGNADGIVSCKTDHDGVCFIEGAAVDRFDANGQELAFAWSMTVDSIAPGVSASVLGRTYRPQAAITVNDRFEEVVAAMKGDANLSEALLAWSWSEGTDSDLGAVAHSYSLTDMGSGLKSLPLGVVMTPPTIDDLGPSDGTTLGLSDDELPVTVLELDGSGLKSLPLGNIQLPSPDGVGVTVAFIDGTGLKSLPLGYHPGDGLPVDLDEPDPIVLGTAVGTTLGAGGWRAGGYGAATLLGSSTVLGIHASLTPQAEAVDGVNLDAVRFD